MTEENVTPEYLYRGVSIEMESKGVALIPHGGYGKQFLGSPRANTFQAGEALEINELNAKKEHQVSSSLYKHSAISSTPLVERAIFYALHDKDENPVNEGWVYKFQTSKMINIDIKHTRDNEIQCHPEDEEHILHFLKDGKDCELGVIEKFRIIRSDI